MDTVGNPKLSEERYLEIKKIARAFYSEYNFLPRTERKQYLDELPRLSSEYERMILRTTLLFPDTKELVSMAEGNLLNYLKNIKEHDNIMLNDITFKILEYKVQGTRDLIKSGKLETLSEISYPESSVAEEKYITLKKEALANVGRFQALTMLEKRQLICAGCVDSVHSKKVQIATLIIPDDITLMMQLENAPIEEVANYYQVPINLIKFKQEEYRIQGTKRMIDSGKLPKFKSSVLWYKDLVHDPVINNYYDQKFYQEIEKGYIKDAIGALETMFDGPMKKTKH